MNHPCSTVLCDDCETDRRAGHYFEFINLEGRPNKYQALCRKCNAIFEHLWKNDPPNPWWIRRRITKTQYLTLMLEAKL